MKEGKISAGSQNNLTQLRRELNIHQEGKADSWAGSNCSWPVAACSGSSFNLHLSSPLDGHSTATSEFGMVTDQFSPLTRKR